MKIVFVHPGLGDGGFNTFGKGPLTSQINHGLCQISAFAKKSGFNDISLIDMRKLRNWSEFEDQILTLRPDVCGISFMSCDYNAAVQAAGSIKKCSPATVIVAGGVHPTVATEEVSVVKAFDHIVVGEGEISFVELLNSIEKDQTTDRIIYGKMPNLDDLPFDDRELFDYQTALKYTNFPGFFKTPSVSIIASRGCPFNCKFCAPHAQTMFGKKVRYRSVDNVMAEIRNLYKKYQFKSLRIFDYSIFLNKSWMDEFCEKFKAEGIKCQIWANCRADLISSNEEGIKKLKDIGLRMVAIGMESGSQRMLDFLHKGTTVEQNIQAAEICKRNGIAVRGLFMLGIPTETEADVEATLGLIRRAKPDVYSFSFYTPVPGTWLYDYCKEHDLSLIKSHDELANMGPGSAKIKGVDYEYLQSAVEEAMGYRFGGRISGKLIRLAFIHTRKGQLLKVRHLLKYMYARWVLLRGNIVN